MLKITNESTFEKEHDDLDKLDDVSMSNDLGDAGAYVTPGQIDDWMYENGENETIDSFIFDKNREMFLDVNDENKLRAMYYENDSVCEAVRFVAAQAQKDEARDDLDENAEAAVAYIALTDGDMRISAVPTRLYEIVQDIVGDGSDPLDRVPNDVREEAEEKFKQETGLSVDDYMKSDKEDKDLFNPNDMYSDLPDCLDEFDPDGTESLRDQFNDRYETDTYLSDATVQDIIDNYYDEIIDALKYDVPEPIDDINMPIYELDDGDIREMLSTYCNQAPLIQDDVVEHLVGDVDNDYSLGRTTRKLYDLTTNNTISMSQLMEEVEDIQNADKKLLNIEVTGRTMHISAGDLDHIPADFIYIPGGSNISNIFIDNSIKSIGPNAFRSKQSVSLELPDDIEVCDNFASAGWINFIKVGDKTYDLRGDIGADRYIGQIIKVSQILDEHGIPSTSNNIANALEYFSYSNAYAPTYNLQTITNPKTRGKFVQEPFDQMATEALAKACNNYKDNELEPPALMSIQDMAKVAQQAVANDKAAVEYDLSEDFKKNYRGHVPHVINLIAEARYYSEIPEDYASNKRFNPNEMKFAIQHNIPAAQPIFLMGMYKNPELHNVLQSPHEYIIYKALKDDIERTGQVTDKTKAFVDFAAKMSDTPEKTIKTISEYRESLDFSHPTLEGLMAEIHKQLAAKEAERVEEKYNNPKCNFKLSECKCNLKNADVTLGKYHAYILDAQDPRQTSVGYDTACCQHLGDAGESAMMYGLMNPNAGFFVIEHKNTGKVVAQGETWESDKETLVFDNLEFAEDRDVRLFLPVLAKWANEVDYKNVYSGIGYNQIDEMDEGHLTHHHGIVPPHIPEVPDPYTDADEKTFVIKKDGKIDPYFSKAYERTTGKPLPLIPERKVKEQSKDIATPYIEKATREQFKDAPTFQQVMEQHVNSDIDR